VGNKIVVNIEGFQQLSYLEIWEIDRIISMLGKFSEQQGHIPPSSVTIQFESTNNIDMLGEKTALNYSPSTHYLGLYPHLTIEDWYPTSTVIIVCYDYNYKTPKKVLVGTICHEWFHMIGALNQDPNYDNEKLANKWENKHTPMILHALQVTRDRFEKMPFLSKEILGRMADELGLSKRGDIVTLVNRISKEGPRVYEYYKASDWLNNMLCLFGANIGFNGLNDEAWDSWDVEL